MQFCKYVTDRNRLHPTLTFMTLRLLTSFSVLRLEVSSICLSYCFSPLLPHLHISPTRKWTRGNRGGSGSERVSITDNRPHQMQSFPQVYPTLMQWMWEPSRQRDLKHKGTHLSSNHQTLVFKTSHVRTWKWSCVGFVCGALRYIHAVDLFCAGCSNKKKKKIHPKAGLEQEACKGSNAVLWRIWWDGVWGVEPKFTVEQEGRWGWAAGWTVDWWGRWTEITGGKWTWSTGKHRVYNGSRKYEKNTDSRWSLTCLVLVPHQCGGLECRAGVYLLYLL